MRAYRGQFLPGPEFTKESGALQQCFADIFLQTRTSIIIGPRFSLYGPVFMYINDSLYIFSLASAALVV